MARMIEFDCEEPAKKTLKTSDNNESKQEEKAKKSKSVAYVETSLDDLSYSSASSRSSSPPPLAGASGQSDADEEENERQLIERLKRENQQRQLRQLEQLEQQQQQQQLARFKEYATAAPEHKANPSDDEGDDDGEELADEQAPQVPVRRSSAQVAQPRTQVEGTVKVVIPRRPALPPPPPPPPPTQQPSRRPRPPPPPRTHSVRAGPKEIWSPTSGNSSSSCGPLESFASNEQVIVSSEQRQVAPVLSNINSSNISTTDEHENDDDDDDDEATVVEKRQRVGSSDDDCKQLAKVIKERPESGGGNKAATPTTRAHHNSWRSMSIVAPPAQVNSSHARALESASKPMRSFSIATVGQSRQHVGVGGVGGTGGTQLGQQSKQSATSLISAPSDGVAQERGVESADEKKINKIDLELACEEKNEMETEQNVDVEKSNSNSNNNNKEQWFKQMYKQMHRPLVSAERSVLDAIEDAKQQQQTQEQAIKIKLKSPHCDHKLEPAYYDPLAARRSTSPAFVNGAQRPGLISDYLPGESSISQHERNLLLYHKLIEHINRVFSSVLQRDAALMSRSTNALATSTQQATNRACCATTLATHSIRRRRRRSASASAQTSRRRLQQQHRSGPQTPAYRVRSTQLKDVSSTSSGNEAGDEHDKRCVFNRLINGDDANQQDSGSFDGRRAGGSLDRRRHSKNLDEYQHIDCSGVACDDHDDDDPRMQYVAVQKGRDIPLKGLRKPAPQPNIYKVGPAPPTLELGGAWNLERYREHNLRLAQSLQRRPNNKMAAPTGSGNSNSMPRNCTQEKLGLIDSWQDDLYGDFNSIYRTLCRTDATGSVRSRRLAAMTKPEVNITSGGGGGYSQEATFETRALAESLADVELALRRATTTGSERTDSRNTEQSSLPASVGGPALVEEMTLSDLEDEICSTLAAARDAERERRFKRRAALEERRSRQPLALGDYWN